MVAVSAAVAVEVKAVDARWNEEQRVEGCHQGEVQREQISGFESGVLRVYS